MAWTLKQAITVDAARAPPTPIVKSSYVDRCGRKALWYTKCTKVGGLWDIWVEEVKILSCVVRVFFARCDRRNAVRGSWCLTASF